MRTITTTKTVYLFSELSEDAQNKAIAQECESRGEFFDHEAVYEDAATIAEILGIDLRTRPTKLMNGDTRMDPCIYYSGFWSQGDGARFEGTYAYAKGSRRAIREHAPQDVELHRLADELQNLQRRFFYRLTATTVVRGHYQHSGCMQVDVDCNDGIEVDATTEEELTQLLRDFADWIYSRLRDEYEYQTSEETAREWLEESGDEFLENGVRA